MEISVTLDVPNLGQGLAFYGDVFGFVETARPIPTYAVLASGAARLCLMEKAAGTPPFEGAPGRDYARHWTPVHLDFRVEDFEAVLERLEAAGGRIERRWDVHGRPPIAFCADPFGHGLCVLGAGP